MSYLPLARRYRPLQFKAPEMCILRLSAEGFLKEPTHLFESIDKRKPSIVEFVIDDGRPELMAEVRGIIANHGDGVRYEFVSRDM